MNLLTTTLSNGVTLSLDAKDVTSDHVRYMISGIGFTVTGSQFQFVNGTIEFGDHLTYSEIIGLDWKMVVEAYTTLLARLAIGPIT